MTALFDQTKKTKYFITTKGEIFSICGNKRIEKKGSIHNRGYVYVRTSNGNYQLHRLIASAFIPNPENKPCINHKNGIKTDNRIENLEWCTYKENHDHAIKNGLCHKMKKNEGHIKHSIKKCRDVVDSIKNGMTYVKAGEIYDMPYSTVAHLMRGSRRLL